MCLSALAPYAMLLTPACLLQFRVTTLDVGVPEEAAEIIKLAETMGPVGGIFHTALYLADKLLENQVRCLLMKQQQFVTC